MKKTIKIWAAVLILSLFISATAQAAPLLGSRALKYGMSGDDVKELQALLKRLGYFSASTTGYFGDITKQSVLNFQAAYGLTRDGSAGTETIYKLKYENGIAADYYAYFRTLKKGMSGGDVQSLQEVLKRLGYFPQSTNTTQYFGSQTHAAVVAFQTSAGLVVDGSVGPATSNALNNALAKLKSPGSQDITSRSKPSVTYTSYTVKSGDTIWSISNSFSIPQSELMNVNGFTASTVLYIGQTIKIPVHNVPVKQTPGPQYGEYLDWWTEAQYVLQFNVPCTVTDFYTGTSFKAVRTFGANHADCEPLTAADTAAIRNLWNTYHTSYWTSRPVIITINGRRLAASMSAMFHAGLDAYPNGAYVNNRSGDYGSGQNFDAIKGNNADGHFDIHFANSTTHNTGAVNSTHQANVKIAAGIK
ncbi:MAG TPA: peptidoglycan-binding protein [Candidatus Atribacteria bacterium]|nr:peptidoglycan-binding protein [Candidatus Atribacteria bacterium]